MRNFTPVAASLLSLFLASCASLSVDHVNYGWPVEVVATVSPANTVSSDRYGLDFSVAKIAAKEFEDSTALKGAQVRILRNTEGYYFLTAARFKHVYVFSASAGSLSGESIITVSETGLRNPALNLRAPLVELVDGEGFRKLLTNSDITEGNSK